MSSDIAQRDPAQLRAHPLNAAIYDAARDDSDLRQTIAERGIISPLVIDQHGTILAGHRRWRVAVALALPTVPVIVRDIDNPLEAERVLIESNRQREKTASEVMHEADHLTRIIKEENRRRMLAGVNEDGAGGRGHKADPRANSREGLRQRTDTQVAEMVGLKENKYRKLKAVHDTANDETQPAAVREVAQQQVAALDTGDTNAHKAEQAVKKAKVAETMRTLPPGAPDPFADMPRVRAARLVKNAYKALSATANTLTYYTPDEMVEAVELNGDPDYVTDKLAGLESWLADYRRIKRRRGSTLHVVS